MLELELVQFRQPFCASEIRWLSTLGKFQFVAECVFEPTFDEIDGEISDINANPLPTELLRRMNRRAATAKRIKDNVAFIAAGFNDAFEQRERLLRRITQTFLGLSANWIYVGDNINN